MRIGIFGGSFNPPHKMHQDIALGLISEGYIDKVIFVPTSNYYPKPGLVKDRDRLEMVKLMIEGYHCFDVSDYEFGRLTYTYQTLDYFQKLYPDDEIYFICGSDNLSDIDTWKSYQEIFSNFKILVIPREDNMEKLFRKYDKYRDRIIIGNLKHDFLSSTWIRAKLKAGKSDMVREALNRKVLSYIEDHQLYRD